MISTISFVRRDVFYDLHVPGAEHYFAHGMVHHNSGKSFWLCQHLFYLADKNRGRAGLLAAPTYRMLRDATEPALFAMADQLGIELEHHKGDGYIEIPKFGRTRILLRTLENPERLRGPNLAFFGIDEASFSSEASWLRLEGRLRDPLATERAACAAWTPNGHNWTYRKFIKQERPNSEYKAVLAHPYENTHIDPTFYAGLLKSYSRNFARQEILGEYLNVFSGRAYDSFSSEPQGNIWRRNEAANYQGFLPCVYHRDRPILWSLDFNLSPATSIIAQSISHTPKPPRNDLFQRPTDSRIGGDDKQLNVLDEVFANDINTEKHCELFYDKVRTKLIPGYKTHVIVYGDATGNRRQSSATESDYAIIRRFFARHSNEFVLETRVPEANPHIKDRVNAVNALCANYHGHRRLAVHERCRHLVEDMEQQSWATDGAGNQQAVLSTKNPVIGHISDSLGYLVAMDFAIRGTAGGKPGFIQ